MNEQRSPDRWPVGATIYAVVVSTLVATLIVVHLYPLRHHPRERRAFGLAGRCYCLTSTQSRFSSA